MAPQTLVPRSMLIINPNTTTAMTDGLKPLIESLNITDTEFTYFTAPSGVPSINDEDDALISAQHSLPVLRPLLKQHDAFLVCCYSKHPLVGMLHDELRSINPSSPAEVTGIFEASVQDSLHSSDSRFGIVSTGKQWEKILTEAVVHDLGKKLAHERYTGTETTGLNATELHTAPKAEVDARMKAATKRLLDKGARTVCLGCAGMAGMDQTVREACAELLGEEEGAKVRIVDGIISGVKALRNEL